MADGLDVVAVRIQEEGAVVVLVVVRAQAGRAGVTASSRQRLGMERLHSCPEGFFPTSIDLDQLAEDLGEGSRPAYISSVVYGMSAYTLIESDLEESKVRAALDASYRGVFDVDAKVAAEHRGVLQNCRMRTFVHGGSTKGLAGVMDGYDGFRKSCRPRSAPRQRAPRCPSHTSCRTCSTALVHPHAAQVR